MTDTHDMVPKFAGFLLDLYKQGYDEGYNQGRLEATYDIDSALVDAQEAGREVGRNEIIHEVTALPNKLRLEIISALENRIHKEV